MGNRVSLQFANYTKDEITGQYHDPSVVLFSHWGGEDFIRKAFFYAKDLVSLGKIKGPSWPLYRLEPQTVMVDFIRELTHNIPRVDGGIYLGKTSSDGDNSDNGHFIIAFEDTRTDGIGVYRVTENIEEFDLQGGLHS